MTELRPAQGESESAWTKKGQRTGVDMIAAVRRTGEEWHNKQRRSAGKEKKGLNTRGLWARRSTFEAFEFEDSSGLVEKVFGEKLRVWLGGITVRGFQRNDTVLC